jgi:hypothetical protein
MKGAESEYHTQTPEQKQSLDRYVLIYLKNKLFKSQVRS